MAEKTSLQKCESAIASMADKLGSFEENQALTQEHISLLKIEFETLAQDNKEVKWGIAELTELVKTELLQKHHTPTSSVSHSPQTPTNFATFNDSTSNTQSKSRSINWEGFTQPQNTQPFELTARYIDPYNLPEYRNMATTGSPVPPPQTPHFSIPFTSTTLHSGPSTLNAFAPPLYPPPQNSTTHIPQNSFAYHQPYNIYQAPPDSLQ